MPNQLTWKYAPLKQHEVTANDEGNTDCDIAVADPEDGGQGDVKEEFHHVDHYKPHSRNRIRRKLCCDIKTFKSLTNLEKFLIVLAIVLSIVIIIKSSTCKNKTSNDASLPTSSVSPANQSSLCLSRGCVEIASRVATSLDESVDPCEDFYKFSCGGWERSHPLPPGYPRWSTFSTLWQENQIVLKSLLERNSSNDHPTEIKAKSLYRACLDVDAIEKVGTKPMLELIEQFGGWEVLGTWNDSNFDFNATFKKFLPFGTFPLISFGVGADEKMSTQNILQIGASGLMAGSRDYYLNKTVTDDKILSAYLDYMTTVATLLGGDKNSSRVRMLEILNLEKELALILPSLQESRDSSVNYYKTDLGSLKDLAPAFDWSDFIQSAFRDLTNITVNDSEPVLVNSINYVKNVSRIIYKTPKRVLHNYFMWEFLLNFIDALGEKFREAAAQVKKVKYGANLNCVERWLKCISVVDGALGKELGRLYVQKQFSSNSKTSAQEMVSSIKGAFQNNLNQLTWMDDSTKQKASEKVNMVGNLIGFSDKILNQTYLEETYKDFSAPASGTFFDFLISIYKFSVRESLKDLRKPVTRDEWFISPPTVNALYSPTRNTIVFPAGILQPPFYSSDGPKALNFGGIGVVVGHELTHGFDDQGSQYDSSGNLKNWWGNRTLENFKAKTSCMAGQYSSYKENGFNVNGNTTLGENIADNGGLKFAYSAYQEWKVQNTDVSLPSLNYTDEQLFFIAFAQIWCYVVTPERSRNLLLTDVHSPNSIRVKGTLSNSDRFSKAFNCPLGSPMNPKDKCKVW